MGDLPLHRLPDDDLEAALRGLGSTVAWPTAAPNANGVDLAAAVRARIEAVVVQSSPAARPLPRGNRRPTSLVRSILALSALGHRRWQPAGRALILAMVALVAAAAIVGAVGLGLPGLRLILGEAPTLPSATAGPTFEPSRAPTAEALGASLGLGELLDPIDTAGLDARAGFTVRAPADPALGPPDAAYIDDTKGRQVTLLWTTRPELPATLEPEVGLLLSQFRGTIGEGFVAKAIGATTTLERVQVGGRGGFWVSGDPHVFFWDGPDGFVDDPRRWVGDVLLWSDGPITYRLETSLGRDAAVRIAETLP